MPRTTEQEFNCQPLADLTRQLLFAPPERREEQVRRAEALHDLIEPRQSYPLEFFVYRITQYHAESDGDTLLIGEAAAPDLRLLIDRLSRSVRMVVRGDEKVETPEQLAERLNTSTKTLARWRKLGLRWRWMVIPGGRRLRVVYPREAVDAFLKRHGDRVERAASFSQIDAAAKRKLLARARRIAEARAVSLNRIATHLAKRTGRAVETLRQILQQHDRENPTRAIFIDRTGPLTYKQKRVIARAYRMGVPMAQLCRRFKRTRSTIYRAVREHRAMTLRRLRIEYYTSPMFTRADADEVLLRPESDPDYEIDAPADASVAKHSLEDDSFVTSARRAASNRYVDDLPEELRAMFRKPMLAEARQLAMFVRFNYLKYKADRLRQQLDPYDPRAGDLDTIERDLREARRVRDRLVEANLPTVLSVARQQLVSDEARNAARMIEMIESGHQMMIQAVDRFNPFQEQTFLRYVVWTLTRHFAQEAPKAPPPETPRRAKPRSQKREAGSAILRRMRAAARALGVEVTNEEDASE